MQAGSEAVRLAISGCQQWAPPSLLLTVDVSCRPSSIHCASHLTHTTLTIYSVWVSIYIPPSVMDDTDLFFILTPLASFSNRYAILRDHNDLNEAKAIATRLLVGNGISQRTDSRAFTWQLRIAHVLHNQGSFDEAAEIRRRVLHQRRQHAMKARRRCQRHSGLTHSHSWY